MKTLKNDLSLQSYDPPTVNEFLRLANEGRNVEAAEFLARQTARDMVFVYGQSNSPYGWRTNIGRVAGQFGTWSSWEIVELSRGIARGTPAQRRAFAARFAVT